MSKQSLLLVDGDPRSLRVLEVSLRKAGFTVSTAESARAAQEKIVVATPDLIISEIKLDDGDGFELCRRVRATPEWQDIPFMFLTGEVGIENKIRGLELGVDEYLTKPIYIKEIVTRIHMLLQKRQRARIEERKDQRTRFVGRIADMPVVDVIQTIEVSRKSGVIHFVGERNRQAAIYFRDGKVIDAEAGALQAEDAVYRLLTWNEGDFEVVFRTVRRRDVIQIGSQALLMEGMRRLDEWTRLLEQMPPLTTHVDVNLGKLAAKLGEVPDECNRLLRLIDGKRSLMDVIDACDLGDLEALQAIAQLRTQGLLQEVEAELADEPEKPKLSLEEVVASARNEESGPLEMPEVVASSQGTSGVAPGLLPSAEVLAPHGFRPSGLRLVDEAVAAAQAIDPELASWPTGDLVARTITGRARTHSSISSIERNLAERSLTTPDPPELPRTRSNPVHEVRAPVRARTEPGIGTAPPLPYVGPAREAQLTSAQPEAAEGHAAEPHRPRSITAQTVRTRTPPYGARISGMSPSSFEHDEASFNDLDDDAVLHPSRPASAGLDAAAAQGEAEAAVAAKRASSRTIEVLGREKDVAPPVRTRASSSPVVPAVHVDEVVAPVTSRSKTPGGPHLEAKSDAGARRPSAPSLDAAAAEQARKAPTPSGSSPAIDTGRPAASSDERHLVAASRTKTASSQRPHSPAKELPGREASADSGPSSGGQLISDSTPIVMRKDTGNHRVRTVTGSLLDAPSPGARSAPTPSKSMPAVTGAEARSAPTPSKSMPAVTGAEARKALTPSKSMPAVTAEARPGRARTSEIEVEAGWDEDDAETAAASGNGARADSPSPSKAAAGAALARASVTMAAVASAEETRRSSTGEAVRRGAAAARAEMPESPDSGVERARSAVEAARIAAEASLRGGPPAEGGRGNQVATRSAVEAARIAAEASLRGDLLDEGSRSSPASEAAKPGHAATAVKPGHAATAVKPGHAATAVKPGQAAAAVKPGQAAAAQAGEAKPAGQAASAGPAGEAARAGTTPEGTKVPTPARTSTRPGTPLPPGSGTSVAIARKRRPSPAVSRASLQPAGLDPAVAPAAVARITTEQRAVKPLEVVETASTRRATRPMEAEEPAEQPATTRKSTRRMITSLGAATAEVSGEVEAPFEEPAQAAEPQRQMVTILPRRITREMPVIEAAVEISEELAPVSPAAKATPVPSSASAGGAAGKRVTRELRVEPELEQEPVRKSSPDSSAAKAAAGAAAPGASSAGPAAPAAPASGEASGGRRVTRELPAEPAEPQPGSVDARATRPLLTRRRVTEPGTPLAEQDAAAADAAAKSSAARRITREVPAAAMLELAAEAPGGAEAPLSTAPAAMVTSSMSATASSKDADLTLDEGAGKAAPAGGAEADENGDADAGELVVSEQEVASPASSKEVAARTASEPAGGKPAAAAAVSPRWSGTRSEKTRVRSYTAIAFGVAGVLMIVVVAVWLRSKPSKPVPSLPETLINNGKVVRPDAQLPEHVATPDGPDAGPLKPTGSGTPVPPPSGTPVPPPSGTPVPPPSGTPVPPPSGTPVPPPSGTPVTGEAKPDPGKESKALLLKAKKALSEGNAEGALLHADEALELKKSARAHLMRASALQAMGRTEDALAAIDRAIAMADEFAEGWLNRGRILDTLGRTGEARAAFARFLELQPTGAAADEVRKKLGQ